MAAYTYVLHYGSVRRYIDSELSITSGAVVRIIKPADDRAASDDFKVGPEDMIPMIVQDYAIEYHESAHGGLKKITVLYLVPPQPKKPADV